MLVLSSFPGQSKKNGRGQNRERVCENLFPGAKKGNRDRKEDEKKLKKSLRERSLYRIADKLQSEKNIYDLL